MTRLDLHDGQDDDAGDAAKKRGPGRPKKTTQIGDLEKEMREQLEELAEWMRKRDPELAETFLEDVARMAKFLATRAGKHERLARILKVMFAKDGPLAGLRAFGRTFRVFAARLNARRAAQEETGPGDADFYVDDAGNTRDRNGNVVVPGL